MSVSSTAKGACHCQEGGNVRVRSDQFRQYAEEALLWAAQSTTKEEKQLLLELVCTWTQAAVASERTVTGPTIHEPSKVIGLAAGA